MSGVDGELFVKKYMKDELVMKDVIAIAQRAVEEDLVHYVFETD